MEYSTRAFWEMRRQYEDSRRANRKEVADAPVEMTTARGGHGSARKEQQGWGCEVHVEEPGRADSKAKTRQWGHSVSSRVYEGNERF